MNEPVHRFFGHSIAESIEKTPNELEIDAVGLWQIIPQGRWDFGLSGEALEDFTKRHIVALIKKGAIPVRSVRKGEKFWEPQLQYGTSPEEIADRVIAEWKSSGVDPDVSGVWFALPEK